MVTGYGWGSEDEQEKGKEGGREKGGKGKVEGESLNKNTTKTDIDVLQKSCILGKKTDNN